MKNVANKKVVLFGGGDIGRRVYNRLGNTVIAVIDNNTQKQGNMFADDIPFISMQDYLATYSNFPVLISTIYASEVIKQLEAENIFDYSYPIELWKRDDVPIDEEIANRCWPTYLKKLCDKPGFEVLELGSRRVNVEDKWNEYFEKANYTGFDYYLGENVDVVGDAHRLSEYFDKKFDLIFSSAVFEHLAMPWKVAVEIIKLLNPGGYVFIETHYSFSSHERPWHFFQYSEEALNVLFPEKFGMKCLKKGCSNLIEGRFSEEARSYLRGRMVGGLYCHSEFLAQKVKEVNAGNLSWDEVCLEDVTGNSRYPIK